MSRLREKLEKHTTKNRWVHTVWGIGYCFEPDGGNDKMKLRYQLLLMNLLSTGIMVISIW